MTWNTIASSPPAVGQGLQPYDVVLAGWSAGLGVPARVQLMRIEEVLATSAGRPAPTYWQPVEPPPVDPTVPQAQLTAALVGLAGSGLPNSNQIAALQAALAQAQAAGITNTTALQGALTALQAQPS